MRFGDIDLFENFLLFEYKDESSAVQTLLALWRRMKGGSTPEEKKASELLFKRILAKVAQDYGQSTADRMAAYVETGQADKDDAALKPAKRDRAGNIVAPAQQLTWPPYVSGFRSSPPPRPEPKTGPSGPASSSGSSSRESHPGPSYYDPASGWTFTRLLRFTGPSATGGDSDKIWGYASNGDRMVIFWGKYGGRVQLKPYTSHLDAVKIAKAKLLKGYRAQTIDSIRYGYLFKQALSW